LRLVQRIHARIARVIAGIYAVINMAIRVQRISRP
jgi:hypothetical protein